MPCVVIRNADGDLCLACADGLVHLVNGACIDAELEDVGAGKALQKMAALLCARFVKDYGGNLADIRVHGKAEEEQLHHRDEERKEERARIAHNVQEFLAADRDKAVEELLHWPASIL